MCYLTQACVFNRPIRNSGNIYGWVAHVHTHTYTRLSHSGEISQEQRCIPEAGSDIDWTWKLSRAECISRATSTRINKQLQIDTFTPRKTQTHSYCLFTWILSSEGWPNTAAILTTRCSCSFIGTITGSHLQAFISLTCIAIWMKWSVGPPSTPLDPFSFQAL